MIEPPPPSLRPIEVPHDGVKDSQAGCKKIFIWYQSTWLTFQLVKLTTKQLKKILHLDFLYFSKFTSHFLFRLFYFHLFLFYIFHYKCSSSLKINPLNLLHLHVHVYQSDWLVLNAVSSVSQPFNGGISIRT